MNRAARNRFPGQREAAKPTRSITASLEAANDREAVTTALGGFLAGQPRARQLARVQLAAVQIATLMADLTGAACSAVSKGPGASIVAFGRGEGE